MHQNIALQTAFYNASDTNDSTKQDLPSISQFPFSISLTTNAHSMTRPTSFRSLWTNAQKENYSIFSCYFREVLSHLKPENLNWNVFKGMAKFIKTRNAQQCRSHHLKLINEFQGIGKFLSRSDKRIRRLQQKIQQVQNVLTQIQEEFQLFYEGQNNNKRQKRETLFQENSLIQGNQVPIYNTTNQEKMDKQELKKTAASYEDAQNPVNNNHFFGSLSSNKFIPNAKVKTNRSSLPSFEYNVNLIENYQNTRFKAGISSKEPIDEFKNYDDGNCDNAPIQIYFETFNVPAHIRTTSQMYMLWENSCDNFAKEREQQKL